MKIFRKFAFLHFFRIFFAYFACRCFFPGNSTGSLSTPIQLETARYTFWTNFTSTVVV